MTVAALCFALMNALIREAAQKLHTLQVAFFRNFFALLFILPWLARVGPAGLRTQRLGLHRHPFQQLAPPDLDVTPAGLAGVW